MFNIPHACSAKATIYLFGVKVVAEVEWDCDSEIQNSITTTAQMGRKFNCHFRSVWVVLGWGSKPDRICRNDKAAKISGLMCRWWDGDYQIKC